LVITRAALVSGVEAVLSVEIEGKSFALGTLRKEKKEQLTLELRFWDILQESYKISVSGKGAKVDLTGYFHPPEVDELDSGDSEDSDPNLAGNVMVEEITDEEAEQALAASEKKADQIKKGKGGKKGQSPVKQGEKHVEKPAEKPHKPEEKSEVKGEKVDEKPAGGLGRKRERDTSSGQTTPKGNPAKKQKPNSKPEGAFKCELCQKGFGTESGLQAHNKAKHK